jgi:opacity protein-like surface antigen
MKKIYCILAVAAAMLFAAEASAQIGVGFGYNLNNNVCQEAGLKDANQLNGFYVEATYDFKFLEKNWGDLGFQPGLRFSYAGAHDSAEFLGVLTKSSWNETYLDIPVLVKYSQELNELDVFLFAGPVFSCGLSSTSKTGTNENTLAIDVYERDQDYSRFDLKLGVGLGVTCLDKLNVKVGYNIGMLNRNVGELDLTYRTGVFYAGIGYSFR